MSKVLGLGNALVDLIIEVPSDSLLDEFCLPKGSMTLVNEEKASRVLETTKDLKFQVAAGGSASNTINGLARLGVDCGYIGKIGKDPYGELFKIEMESNHIRPILMYGKNQTGTAITLLSIDAERTFATCLGAALELTADDLKEDHFKGYDYFHIEGYLVQNHDLILKAVQTAAKKRIIVSLDMASYNVVEANKEFLKDILEKYVDIVFANEEEAKTLTGKEPEEAAHILGGYCRIAAVKIGKKGSWIKNGRELTRIKGIQSVVKDTTGAGDLYASGFLYGLLEKYDMATCGNIGSLVGGNVVEIHGARMSDEKWERIRATIEKLS